MSENLSYQQTGVDEPNEVSCDHEVESQDCGNRSIEDLLEDILAIKRPAGLAVMNLSPDGRLIAISAQSVQKTRFWMDGEVRRLPEGAGPFLVGSSIVVVDTQTGQSLSPFPDGSNSWSGQWSKDGRYLAAYVQVERAACLGLFDRETHKTIFVRKAPTNTYLGLCPPQWSPDGKKVVVPLAPLRESESPAKSADLNDQPKVRIRFYDPQEGDAKHGSWQERAQRLEMLIDLGIVDMDSLEVRRFALSEPILFWRIAPDGDSVAYVRIVEHDDTKGVWLSKIELLSLQSGNVREVAQTEARTFFTGLNWSPDGSRIAFFNSINGNSIIRVASVDGSSEPIDVSPANESVVGSGWGYGPPYWSSDGQNVFGMSPGKLVRFQIDGDLAKKMVYENVKSPILSYMSPILGDSKAKVFLASVDNGAEGKGVAKVDLGTGEVEKLVEFHEKVSAAGWELAWEVDPSQSVAYVLADSLGHIADLWQISMNDLQAKKIFSLNPNLERMTKPIARSIRYRAQDFNEYETALYLPPDYQEGTRLPMIVCVYGGSMGNTANMNGVNDAGGLLFRSQVRLLTAKGYAVLNPDIPWFSAEDKMRNLFTTVLSAINRAVELGIADPDRLGLIGHSCGGYCVLALLCQTTIFKAAVASASYVNLTSLYGGNLEGFSERGKDGVGGTLWEKPKSHIENSPIFYLDRVKTPLLLVCGTHDEEWAVSQAQETFGALKRLHQRVEMRVYEGEQHRPDYWSAASLRDLSGRINEWFDAYLAV